MFPGMLAKLGSRGYNQNEDSASGDILNAPGPTPPKVVQLGVPEVKPGELPPTAKKRAEELKAQAQQTIIEGRSADEILAAMDARKLAAETAMRTDPNMPKPLTGKRAFLAGFLASAKDPDAGFKIAEQRRQLALQPYETGKDAASSYLRAMEASQAEKSANVEQTVAMRRLDLDTAKMKQDWDILQANFAHDMDVINKKGEQELTVQDRDIAARFKLANQEFANRLDQMKQQYVNDRAIMLEKSGLDLQNASFIANQEFENKLLGEGLSIGGSTVQTTDPTTGQPLVGPASIVMPGAAREATRASLLNLGTPRATGIAGQMPIPLEDITFQRGGRNISIGDVITQLDAVTKDPTMLGVKVDHIDIPAVRKAAKVKYGRDLDEEDIEQLRRLNEQIEMRNREDVPESKKHGKKANKSESSNDLYARAQRQLGIERINPEYAKGSF